MNMSDAQRVNGWLTAARALRDHPWRWPLGWGPETFRSVYRLNRTQHAADLIGYGRIADHAHNLPLELLVTLGVVGAAAVGYLGWRLWKEADEEGRACMLGLLAMSMVEPVFFPPAAMLFLLLGVGRRELLFAYWWEPFWARLGALALVALCLGVWAFDNVPGRSLALHPRESEANQLAIMAALQQGKNDLAVVYARRAAAADPMHRDVVKQAAALEAAVGARRALAR